MVQCAALNCSNRPNSTTGVSFFSFPKDKKHSQIWIRNLRRENYHPNSASRLCSEHFEETCFRYRPSLMRSIGYTPKKQILLPGAVPTIFNFKRKEAGKKGGTLQRVDYLTRGRARVIQDTLNTRTCADEGQTERGATHTAGLKEEIDAVQPESIKTEFEEVQIGSLKTEFEEVQTGSIKTEFEEVQIGSIKTEFEEVQIGSIKTEFEEVQTGSWKTEYDEVHTAGLTTEETDLEVDSQDSRSCQTESGSRSVGIMCAVKMKSKGTSTTRRTADVGVQCTLLTPNPGGDYSDGPESEEEPETDEEDPDWTPDAEEFEDEDFDLGDVADSCPSAERKYIVFESCLRTLFAVCVVCSGACDVTMRLIMGTMVAVSSVCKRTDAHTRVWYSQSVHNRMPVGNLMIAAATMFSGCPAAIARNLFQHMGVGTYSLRTYFSLQRCYLIPAIRRLWSAKQQAMLMKRKGIPLRLGGYARCCSPGHSAKYGSYSLMDLSTGEVLTTHLVQCNEVQSRAAMELEGLKRGIGFLQRHGLSVAELTSGRHVQVCKWLRTEMPNIRHRFDVRRVSKDVFRKLVAVSKKPQCASVGRWARSISNHLCWTAASSGGDADMAVQKWTSVARHICNIHEGHGDVFPRCQHGETDRQWLEHGSSAQKELEAVVLSSRLLKDVPQLSPAEETSCLEEFHNVVCFFTSKHEHFLHPSVEARVTLAALHLNENVQKERASIQDGPQRWKVLYPKFKKGGVVQPAKEFVMYDYVRQLMKLVWQMRLEFHEDVLGPDAPVVSHVQTVIKTEDVAAHKTQFNNT
ncbi:uncharacterized protein LOC108232837 [Kryptolebias marmoratus]|uniref:uncharacterized protein LOC108232837 n=1 Tax=Kryptolebias marmoratus TaxID=37003 RepID=UPI0007F87F10|nr:uncharacterized protein LOC108232837 [Kryptolebias marmoratus]